jgi:hypothetical protein
MEDVIEEQDVDYSAMTTKKTKKFFNMVDSAKPGLYKRRESQEDVINDLFKPKQEDGVDAMEKVILKYTNVIPKKSEDAQLPKIETQAKIINKIRPVTLTAK